MGHLGVPSLAAGVEATACRAASSITSHSVHSWLYISRAGPPVSSKRGGAIEWERHEG